MSVPVKRVVGRYAKVSYTLIIAALSLGLSGCADNDFGLLEANNSVSAAKYILDNCSEVIGDNGSEDKQPLFSSRHQGDVDTFGFHHGSNDHDGDNGSCEPAMDSRRFQCQDRVCFIDTYTFPKKTGTRTREFDLDESTKPIDFDAIEVTVNGHPANFEYLPDTHQVRLLDETGEAEAVITISYCSQLEQQPFEILEFRVQSVGTVAARVTWKTDIPATSQVIVIRVADGQEFTTPPGEMLVTDHEVNVMGLSPGTVYQLRAVSVSGSGGMAVSPLASIRTAQ